MQTTIIYPGTFDPITNGHIDLIKRSLQIFDKIIVAVAEHTNKTTLFSLQQRVELIKKVLTAERITIKPFSGLLVKFAKQQHAQAILRGLRVVSDFEYELQLADINHKLDANIETIFLTPTEHFSYISSSMVREIASLGGDITPFVPQEIALALQKINAT